MIGFAHAAGLRVRQIQWIDLHFAFDRIFVNRSRNRLAVIFHEARHSDIDGNYFHSVKVNFAESDFEISL